MRPFARQPAFDPEGFLSENWQQKPRLLSGFFPAFEDPLSPEELAGLACEEEVESRLLRQLKGRGWELEHGPFPEQRFLELPESHWTVLVQAVDQHWPDLRALMGAFDFLPSWRLDDVMVSYAAPEGGVGPHFDQYDVFLVQGQGQRRWSLGAPCDPSTPVQTVAGQALLKEFKPETSYLLNPGDVLYVPAGFAHEGVAVEAGLCYSVGFRAPSEAELIDSLADRLIRDSAVDARYRDPPGSDWRGAPGEIRGETLTGFFERLRTRLADPRLLLETFAEVVTDPRYPEMVTRGDAGMSQAELQKRLRAGERLQRNPGSRFAFSRQPGNGELLLSVDGQNFWLTQSKLNLVLELCDTRSEFIKKTTVDSFDESDRELLLQLLHQGSLCWQ